MLETVDAKKAPGDTVRLMPVSGKPGYCQAAKKAFRAYRTIIIMQSQMEVAELIWFVSTLH